MAKLSMNEKLIVNELVHVRIRVVDELECDGLKGLFVEAFVDFTVGALAYWRNRHALCICGRVLVVANRDCVHGAAQMRMTLGSQSKLDVQPKFTF